MPRTDMKININGQMVALPEGFDDYIDWSRAAIVELDMHGGHLDPEPDCPAPSARGRDIIDDVNKFNQACRDLGIPIVHIVNTYRREIDEGKESAWRRITEEHYSLLGEKYVAMTKNFCNLALEDTKWSTLVVENKPGDVVVNTKKRVTAFETTDLDLVMRALGKDVMVITGIMTNCCDLCTAYYAGKQGLQGHPLLRHDPRLEPERRSCRRTHVLPLHRPEHQLRRTASRVARAEGVKKRIEPNRLFVNSCGQLW